MNQLLTDHSPDIVAAAVEVLVAEQSVSISLLQRRLKLGYSTARSLMAILEKNGVVGALNDNEFRTLTQEYKMKDEPSPAMSNREKYIRSVFETTLFLWESHEEGNGGNTKAISLLSPAGPTRGEPVRQRKAVFKVLEDAPNVSLFSAAYALASWLLENYSPAVEYGEIKDELEALCAEQNLRYKKVKELEAKIERSYIRLARFIQRVSIGEAPENTDCFINFIPVDFIPKGYGKNGPGWGEHIVPRKYLLHCGVALFKEGWSIKDVAREMRQHLAVVYISDAERKYLDYGPSLGGLKLKDGMPKGWRLGVDCPYKRLHMGGIAFDPPLELKPCTCVNAPGFVDAQRPILGDFCP